jgi:hypothetical protein
MRYNKISGIIGIVLGFAMLIALVLRGGPQGRGAYAVGQYMGMAMAVLLVVAGLVELLKSGRSGGK